MNTPKVGQKVASQDGKVTHIISSIIGLRPFDIWSVKFQGDKQDRMIHASATQNGWVVR